MEIAPRIPGAMALHRSLGINFPLLSLYAHLGRPTNVLVLSLREVTCCKVYANHYAFDDLSTISALYVDLDDTLLIHASSSQNSDLTPQKSRPKANPKVAALLYEARAVGMPVHLITRHRSDVAVSLDLASIHTGLFETVIHINNEETPKSAFILARPSALLDDSFRERQDACNAGILTFDIDALEILRDLVRKYEMKK
jgi:hypothetical protein